MKRATCRSSATLVGDGRAPPHRWRSQGCFCAPCRFHRRHCGAGWGQSHVALGGRPCQPEHPVLARSPSNAKSGKRASTSWELAAAFFISPRGDCPSRARGAEGSGTHGNTRQLGRPTTPPMRAVAWRRGPPQTSFGRRRLARASEEQAGALGCQQGSPSKADTLYPRRSSLPAALGCWHRLVSVAGV